MYPAGSPKEERKEARERFAISSISTSSSLCSSESGGSLARARVLSVSRFFSPTAVYARARLDLQHRSGKEKSKEEKGERRGRRKEGKKPRLAGRYTLLTQFINSVSRGIYRVLLCTNGVARKGRPRGEEEEKEDEQEKEKTSDIIVASPARAYADTLLRAT